MQTRKGDVVTTVVLLRGIEWPVWQLGQIGLEHDGDVVLDERLNVWLERALKNAKARKPNLAVQTMRHPLFPAEEFIPVEITVDPFNFGRQFRSGYHLFVRRKRSMCVS